MTAALFGEISTIIQDGEAHQLAQQLEPVEEVDYDEFSEDLAEEQLKYLAEKRE